MVRDGYQFQGYSVYTNKVGGLVIVLVQTIIIGSQIENDYQYRIPVEGVYQLRQNLPQGSGCCTARD